MFHLPSKNTLRLVGWLKEGGGRDGRGRSPQGMTQGSQEFMGLLHTYWGMQVGSEPVEERCLF